MDINVFQISPVSIAPLAELMFSLVITIYFFSVRNKTFETWLVTIHSCIATCMFALNFITTATLQSEYGPGIEKIQYITIACLSLFNVLFAYLFGGNPFKKEMAIAFFLLLLLFGTALYFDKIAFPYTLPVYMLTAGIIIAVFLRKARRSLLTTTQGVYKLAREAIAYRGFALCFFFYLAVNIIASFGVAGWIPASWWMLIVQVFIYAYLFSFLISYLNYSAAPVSFVTRLEGVLLYIHLMVLGALGLLLYGVEIPDAAGRRALKVLAILIPVTTVGVLILVPLFFRKNLLKPLRSILEGMRRVDAGDLSGDVPVTTNDEIGALTESFNRMTTSLRQYALQMENLVAERTAELSARQRTLENTLYELEQTQQQLKKATEQKNRFFDNITHELKTPLTLILAPLEHLSASPSLTEETDLRAIRLIDRNAKNLLTLVNQLLDLSKIESGELTIRETPGIISAVTGMVVNDFLILAMQKRVSINYENLIPDGPVLFDHERWEQIAKNLLSNAIKFTQQGGTVTVSTHLSEDSQVVLTVSDSGTGIKESELENIFDRFYQVAQTKPENHAGTGLGLALVRELCNLMNGKIDVDSQEGTGSVFTVRIPVKLASPVHYLNQDKSFIEAESVIPHPHKESVTKQENSERQHAKNWPLLLIVEDNKELLDFLCMLLDSQYKILTAANGREGLQIATKELPDIVISDVMMPELDGIGFLKALKSDIRTSHIGVILLTAKSDDRSRMEGLMTGADQYLQKPFYPTELKLRLHNLLSIQEKTRRYFEQHFKKGNEWLPDLEPSDPFVRKLFLLIEENIDNSQLGPEMLASAMAMSARTLTRKISTVIGMAPAALIRDYRLKKASSLLLAGKTVAESAYGAGFENPSYFSTAFKAHFQVTPTEYQKKQGT